MNKAYALRHLFQNAAETTGNGNVLDVTGLSRLGIQVSYAAAESASASSSASRSASPSGSTSPSGSQSNSPSGSASPSGSLSISPSGSASPSSSASRSSSPSASLSPSASSSISPSGSTSPSGSASPSASPSAPPSGQSGSVYFEASLNGSEWYSLPMTPVGGGSAVVMTAAPGVFMATVSGLGQVRARLAGTVLGAVTVLGIATPAGS